ncbi:MAG: hypothetical protein Q7T55_16300 [Solirubrobacteraceae bacterium]|nr:hypothetical protein [Solirubrobacteraceae bacterium]
MAAKLPKAQREPRAVPTEETQRWIGTVGLLGGAALGVLVYGSIRPDWDGLKAVEPLPVALLLLWMAIGATVAGSLVELIAWGIMRPFVRNGFVWRGRTPERRDELSAEFAGRWRVAQRSAIALTPRELWLRFEINAVLAVGAGTGAVLANRAQGDAERALTFFACVITAFVAYLALNWLRTWVLRLARRGDAHPGVDPE